MEIVILEKVYGDRSGFKKLHKKLNSLIGDLEVEWKLAVTQKQWVKVTLEGEDEEISANLIREEFGEAPYKLSSVKEGEIYRGRFTDLGKVGYGVYVDIGVFTPRPKDALIPLYYLKDTFGDKAVRKMIRDFGWVDNLPVEVEVKRVEFGAREIEVHFSDKQLKRFKTWFSDGFDKLFIAGTTSERIEEALIATGHSRDVRRIEELGLMETMLVLKKDTQAPGIIKAIGPHIKPAQIGAIKFD
ncbi:hypothetical protein PAP_09150 [Palaeococcus pacificus DY20341]|uniref:DUF2110 family protein n=1 Tax=Palaeococcus pacificus DY20341 TaxID=1343739 RepID=A0A075M086_9EURY|nr:DUF2110 family protein [Palaeococcus pacificus]AIF70208.1 hypothetical protein PAP_09150 [Palaeococcus pacificus DY20341]